MKICKSYCKKKSRLGLDEKILRIFKKTYCRRSNVQNYTTKADGSKKHTRKSKNHKYLHNFRIAIVFDLDGVLVRSHNKKHKLESVDNFVHITVLSRKIRVR
jgi:hypothetical protein